MDLYDGGTVLYDASYADIYIYSIYWSVTTITTVGYGDISGENNLEKGYCIIVMLIGVICFSFASGSLSSILQNYDNQNANYKEKLSVLNRIYNEHHIPLEFYSRLKKAL